MVKTVDVNKPDTTLLGSHQRKTHLIEVAIPSISNLRSTKCTEIGCVYNFKARNEKNMEAKPDHSPLCVNFSS